MRFQNTNSQPITGLIGFQIELVTSRFKLGFTKYVNVPNTIKIN